MQIEITDTGGGSPAAMLELTDGNFGRAFNESLVHQVVVAYLSRGRAGTKAQKTRSDVRGGGAKPWRQKGTGRARAGTSRSPLWRGGGVTFAARPRSFEVKVNRKMYRAAMRSILSELLRQSRLTIVETLEIAEPKTQVLSGRLKELGLDRALLVPEEESPNLYLAARNLPGFGVCEVQSLDPVSLVQADNVVMSVAAVKRLEESLA
jgi:large subunit ribosomal protein L4